MEKAYKIALVQRQAWKNVQKNAQKKAKTLKTMWKKQELAQL